MALDSPSEPPFPFFELPREFSILEDDLGLQELIEKRTAPQDPVEDISIEDIRTCTVDTLPGEVKYKEQDKNRLYPDFLICDANRTFALGQVFDYRGQDQHKMFKNKDGKNVNEKCNAMLQFFADGLPNQGLFGSPTGKAPANKQNDPRFIEMQLRPDTQIPSIVIRIRRPQEWKSTGGDDKWVRFEISAGSLMRTQDEIAIRFTYTKEEVMEDVPNTPVLKDLANEGRLWRTDILLWSEDDKPTTGAVAPPRWYNITPEEINELQDKYHQKEHLSSFEQVVVLLSLEQQFSLFVGQQGKFMSLLPPCCNYMRAICYATANMGYYWWYVLAGRGEPLDSDDYPFVSKKGTFIPFPRWMIDEFDVVYEDDWPVRYEARHVADFDLQPTSNLPDAVSAMWSSRLSMAREVQMANTELNRLCKKLEGRTSCTIITFGDNEYCAALRFEGLTKGMTDSIMPEVKRRCSVFVKVNDIDMELAGAVCEDVFDTNAHCCVHCIPVRPTNPPPIPDGTEYYASVAFKNDTKSNNRCMNAIMSLMQGHVNRTTGVYLPNIALSAPIPDDHYVGQKTFGAQPDPKGSYGMDLGRMIAILHLQGLNTRQFRAGMQLIGSDTPAGPLAIGPSKPPPHPKMRKPRQDGCQLIWGPPGTGKTFGAISLVKALAATGTPVLVTASSNKAVLVAAKAFDDGNRLEYIENPKRRAEQKVFGSISELKWCRFTGAEFDSDWVSKDATAWTKLDLEEHMLLRKLRVTDDSEDEDEDDGDDDGGIWPWTWDEMFEEEQERLLAEKKSGMLAFVVRTAYSKVFVANEADASFASKKLRYVKRFSDEDPAGKDPTKISQATAYKEAIMDLQKMEMKAQKTGKHPKREKREKLVDVFRTLDQWWTKEFLGQCLVVFCTNNTSCHDALAEYYHPKVLHIDEAGFSTPPDAMVPMAAHKDDIEHLVMSGDHEQLKPVVTSSGNNEFFKAVKFSLFEKQYKSELEDRVKTQFNVQFRQAPDLSKFHRDHVYKDLIDHPSVLEDNKVRACFRSLMSRLGPVWNRRLRVAVDCQQGYSGIYQGTASACNFEEANTAYTLALHQMDHGVPPEQITILTPYSGQLRLLNKMIRASDIQDARRIQIASTNEMVGHQNQIVILSLVQHQEDDDLALGFIYMRHLIVIETSRAMNGLFILGNFTGWCQELASAGKDSFLNRDQCSLFKALIQDLYDKKDIIHEADFRDAFQGLELTSSRFYESIKPKAHVLTNRGNLSGRGRGGGPEYEHYQSRLSHSR